jgi:hypothetical protein
MHSEDKSWREVTIRAEAVPEYQALKRQFEAIFVVRSGPIDVAIFTPRIPAADHTLLFTPAAARIAPNLLAALGATPCARPKSGSVMLIFGHDDAMQRFERGEFF